MASEKIKVSQINGNPIVDAELTDKVNDFKTTTEKQISDINENITAYKEDFTGKINDIKKEISVITGDVTENDILDTFKEVSSALDTKANVADVYTKNAVNDLLSEKIASDNVYTKEDIDGKLSEIDTNIGEKVSQTDFDALKEKVATISGDDEAYDTLTELKALVDEKVNSSDFDAFKTENASTLSTKAETEAVNTALEGKVNTTDFEEFKAKNTEDINTAVGNIEGIISKNYFKVTFPKYDAALYSVTIYNGYDKNKADNGSNGYLDPKEITSASDEFDVISKKGNIKFNGTGKFYFKPTPADGYKITRVKVDAGKYDKISVDANGVYTIEGIKDDLEIEITSVSASTTLFTVSFVLEHCSVKAYSDKFETLFDGDASVESGNNVYFVLEPDVGYEIPEITAANITAVKDAYKNLKTSATESDYPSKNAYGITKIKDNISVACSAILSSKTLADYAITNAYTKEETDAEIEKVKASIPTGAYVYKGTVEDMAALKSIENPNVGDVYNVKNAGTFKKNINYAWAGTGIGETDGWDSLGSSVDVDLTDYYTKTELDTKLSAKANALPEVPEAEGTYVLKAVRTTDGVTYSWVLEATTSE